jgi:hypothetical protein
MSFRTPRRTPKQVIQSYASDLFRCHQGMPLMRRELEIQLNAVAEIAKRMGWASMVADIRGRLPSKVIRVPIAGKIPSLDEAHRPGDDHPKQGV